MLVRTKKSSVTAVALFLAFHCVQWSKSYRCSMYTVYMVLPDGNEQWAYVCASHNTNFILLHKLSENHTEWQVWVYVLVLISTQQMFCSLRTAKKRVTAQQISDSPKRIQKRKERRSCFKMAMENNDNNEAPVQEVVRNNEQPDDRADPPGSIDAPMPNDGSPRIRGRFTVPVLEKWRN